MASGEWLEKALQNICGKLSGLDLDADLISGLVSFCELAPPQDAADYLANIVGREAGQDIIQEYLLRRGYVDSSNANTNTQTSGLQAYMKPAANEDSRNATKKQTRAPKGTGISNVQDKVNVSNVPDAKTLTEHQEAKSISKGHSSTNSSKKKKSGKVISLAEAAKGSIVFQQGKPCSCQARRHKLVSNCLSCGKIVCEQEGEGPCSFCGVLVLREGSTYAGLDELVVPHSDAEAAAEAYAKRLVEYDRNSAARTTVIDDQSDYYEIEGNSWLSAEEKDLLMKKQKEIEEANEAQRKKVIVTFDLLGRKVLVNRDEAPELESEHRILRPVEERELNRMKPNPTVKIQPVLVNTGPSRKPVKGKQNKRAANGICLEISGRVQHDDNELRRRITDGSVDSSSSNEGIWQGPLTTGLSYEGDNHDCSLDYD
ncbi:activating signal cointegrator 1 [Dioscorea cayenensis subsp. rotundata]|uniref:Activating signal cointegrator 1 n=1 Tax=Dioscorea cayennensis subsp. rotundata TaxID=55577 RepID=A0AB40BBZ9_DIOCR|nr:activating signal cointegrator 1 [Dioscorea cayenensis subsp. rotundata]